VIKASVNGVSPVSLAENPCAMREDRRIPEPLGIDRLAAAGHWLAVYSLSRVQCAMGKALPRPVSR